MQEAVDEWLVDAVPEQAHGDIVALRDGRREVAPRNVQEEHMHRIAQVARDGFSPRSSSQTGAIAHGQVEQDIIEGS
jgi:hypothetical protein